MTSPRHGPRCADSLGVGWGQQARGESCPVSKAQGLGIQAPRAWGSLCVDPCLDCGWGRSVCSVPRAGWAGGRGGTGGAAQPRTTAAGLGGQFPAVATGNPRQQPARAPEDTRAASPRPSRTRRVRGTVVPGPWPVEQGLARTPAVSPVPADVSMWGPGCGGGQAGAGPFLPWLWVSG